MEKQLAPLSKKGWSFKDSLALVGWKLNCNNQSVCSKKVYKKFIGTKGDSDERAMLE